MFLTVSAVVLSGTPFGNASPVFFTAWAATSHIPAASKLDESFNRNKQLGWIQMREKIDFGTSTTTTMMMMVKGAVDWRRWEESMTNNCWKSFEPWDSRRHCNARADGSHRRRHRPWWWFWMSLALRRRPVVKLVSYHKGSAPRKKYQRPVKVTDC